jgi:hypothetical protein
MILDIFGQTSQRPLSCWHLTSIAYALACAGIVDQPQQSISLRAPPGTVFHSPPGSPISDVFGSPQQPQPGAAAVAGSMPHAAQHVQALPAGGAVSSGGGLFQFQPLLGPAQQAQRDEEADGASSSGDTDDTVSEAAVVARTMRRAGAQGREQVQVGCLGVGASAGNCRRCTGAP